MNIQGVNIFVPPEIMLKEFRFTTFKPQLLKDLTTHGNMEGNRGQT